MNFAILIDAGFAKARLGTSQHPASAEDFIHLVKNIRHHPSLRSQSLYRIYYTNPS